MERQFPKNVRQVGNVSDEPKIYVEDYVDTYLSQIRMKAVDEPVAAALTGEITEHDGQAVVYVSGAMQIKDIEVDGTQIRITDDAKEEMEDTRKRYFPSQAVVGWCLVETGHPMGLHQGADKLHGKLFGEENSVYIWKDALENDEMFFAYKYGELMQMGGHYIYYEKNPAMQNYMINTRRQNGVTPSEMVEDRAAKNFRSAIREKSESREQHQSSRVLYMTSVFLVIVVLVIGVSAMSSYDKMESVQNSLESLSRSVNSRALQGAPQEDGTDGDEEVLAGAQNLQEDVKEDAQGVLPAEDEEDALDTETGGELISEAPGSAEQPEDGEYYTVKKGDTLDTISIDVYGDRDHVESICKMNGLSDGNLIYIGQKLLLP